MAPVTIPRSPSMGHTQRGAAGFRPRVRHLLPSARAAPARTATAFCGILLAAALPACSELDGANARSEPSGGATPLRLPDTPPDVAFDAGLAAMRQYFKQVEASPAEGRIDSGVAEYVQTGGTGRFRDEALKFRNRMRRRATLWITQSGTGSLARCQVRVQRLDTADHRVFEQQQRFDDLPNATPIDRDAGVSSLQNQAWTDLPRDRRREREILQVLFNRAKGTVDKS